MTITALPASIDLTNEQTADVVVANSGTTNETGITLDNAIAGVEVSENGADGPWSTGIAPFDLDAEVLTTVANTDTTWDADHAILNGTSSVLEQNNWDEIGGTGTPICTVYVRFKVVSTPASNTPIIEIPDSRGAGSPAMGIYLQSTGKVWMQYRTSTTIRDFELSNFYNDGNYHDALVRCNTTGFGRYETDLEGLDGSGVNGDFSVDSALGIQIGALQSLSKYNNIHISELKIWDNVQTVASKDSDTGLVFELAWSGTEFYNTVDGVPVQKGAKTLTFRHDKKYISTTSNDTTFSIVGTNPVEINPVEIDPVEDLDLLVLDSTDYINIQNTTSSPVTFDVNKVGGVEYSTDGGSTYLPAAAESSVSISANSYITRHYRHDKDATDITLPPTLTYEGAVDVDLAVDIKPEFSLPTTFVGSNSVETSVTIDNNSDGTLGVDVDAPSEFEIKLTSGSTWSQSLHTSVKSGSSFGLDYRFSPTSVGAKTGDSEIDYGTPTLDVGLSGLGLTTSIASPEVLDFGRVEQSVQSTSKTLTLSNGNPTDVDVTISMPNGFLIKESGGSTYASMIEATIPAVDSIELDVVVLSDDLGTLRGNLLLCFNNNDITVYLRAEVVVATYMNIVLTDNGSEVGRLEKKVIELDRRKLINTETDRLAVNDSPVTTTKIIEPPSGTSAVLIYSKHNVEDEYWRLRVADVSTDALANQGTSYLDIADETISVGSRLWYKVDSVISDFDFFDRDTSPYITPDTNYGNRGIITSDTDYVKLDSALDLSATTAYPFFMHSMDSPHLLAYIPIVFGDKILVNLNKVDTEFEVICLQEV